jgi:hypothetical protein
MVKVAVYVPNGTVLPPSISEKSLLCTAWSWLMVVRPPSVGDEARGEGEENTWVLSLSSSLCAFVGVWWLQPLLGCVQQAAHPFVRAFFL